MISALINQFSLEWFIKVSESKEVNKNANKKNILFILRIYRTHCVKNVKDVNQNFVILNFVKVPVPAGTLNTRIPVILSSFTEIPVYFCQNTGSGRHL